MDNKLIVCETTTGKYAVRPVTWAAEFDKNGRISENVNHVAVFSEKEDAERYVRTGHWVWDENGNDWGIGAWCCSECGCKNDNLGTHNDMDNWFMKRTPYMFVGSKYCPHCGVRMVEPNE